MPRVIAFSRIHLDQGEVFCSPDKVRMVKGFLLQFDARQAPVSMKVDDYRFLEVLVKFELDNAMAIKPNFRHHLYKVLPKFQFV